MTIGRSSKKSQAARSPPFLDRATGFYGRLDEGEAELGSKAENREREEVSKPGAVERNGGPAPRGSGPADRDEPDVFHFDEGMMEDDGTTLLKRKPSRLSRRWSRKSSRRATLDPPSPGTGSQRLDTGGGSQAGAGPGTRAPESLLVHFSVKADDDDQVLILERKESQGEAAEKRNGEMKEKTNSEDTKVAKRSTLGSYRKVLDRAVRRGWETFVANLYSVTLTPISSSSSSSSETSTSVMNKKLALAEYR